MIEKIRAWALALKTEIVVLASALRDSRTPWHAKALGLFVVGYAASPIDLIPDFIPVLGFVDDAILLPVGIWAVRRMIPAEVIAEHRARVASGEHLPPSFVAAGIIIALWCLAFAFGGWMLWDHVGRPWISWG